MADQILDDLMSGSEDPKENTCICAWICTVNEEKLEQTRSRALKITLKGDSLSDLCSEVAPISR
jgi:hypothetical protein